LELKPFRKIDIDDKEISRQFNYVELFLNQLSVLNFLRGSLIEADVSTTAKAFNHKLNREPVGWIIFDKTTNANVWRTDWDERTITLDSSATSSLKVWVF
jgi:hypothetical protein